MSEQTHTDLIVIGTGPGGEGASMQAAKLGKSVVVVERYGEVGGGCTHWGTIPSKALRHAIQELTDWHRNPLVRKELSNLGPDLPSMLRSAASVIERQVDMRQGFYDRNLVPVVIGHARFVDPHTIAVEQPDGKIRRLTADHIVIATGSRPYRPPDVDFDAPGVVDADTVLELPTTPKLLVVYGAGVIGCEYASMFRNLGVKVDLVNTRDRLMSYLDDEVTDALAYRMRDQGVVIRHGECYQRVEPVDDGVVLHLESGKKVKGDVLLWANGRTGNSDDMGLEDLGLVPDSRGQIEVDRHYRTSQPHIYAVGDIIGYPALASAAYDQGRLAGRHLATGKTPSKLGTLIPTGIYTSPEISSVGKTERELTAEKTPYEVGHADFKSLARAQITGQTVGMLKILFHRDTLEILGIHCFGYQASEIVHIGQAIMAQPGTANSVSYFVDTTFNYPTMAEAYRVAALNGLNRLF